MLYCMSKGREISDHLRSQAMIIRSVESRVIYGQFLSVLVGKKGHVFLVTGSGFVVVFFPNKSLLL